MKLYRILQFILGQSLIAHLKMTTLAIGLLQFSLSENKIMQKYNRNENTFLQERN